MNQVIECIINWVVRALNADWLNAVVYQSICHGYEANLLVYVGNQFIIATRHMGGFVVQYSIWPIYCTAAKGCIQVLHVASRLRTALSSGIVVIYHTSFWPYCFIITALSCIITVTNLS
jgi:hypothetical protein